MKDLKIIPKKIYIKEEEEARHEELEKAFGNKKKLAHGYGLPILLALSHYPELKDITIEFVFCDSEQPLSTRPTPATTLLPAKDRTYEISISTNISPSKEPVLLRNLPFNMQIGQLGHELGHIADFLQKNSLEVLADAALYFLPEYKKNLEKKVDGLAVSHGFGYQALAFSEYVYELKEKYPEEDYYQNYHKCYMTPAEIQARMKRLKMYNS
jgi:hypothetical protein